MGERQRNGRTLLKAVSRSFYLSLRLLPKPMREPLSLGYLLARASDTLADTGSIPVREREKFLREFGNCVAGREAREEFQERLCREFVPRQQDEAEARLLQGVETLMAWLEEQPPAIRATIRDVLETIIAGQLWDLTYFSGQGDAVKIADSEALERYIYQVAGCVGEFWTRIGFLTLGSKFSTASGQELSRLGVRYGCGLQLVNILRDVEKDRRLGRCYLPVTNPENSQEMDEVRRHWLATAHEYLTDGLTYAATLRSRRVRAATMLPALLGIETLDLLKSAAPAELGRGVKISRSRVYRNVWKAFRGG